MATTIADVLAGIAEVLEAGLDDQVSVHRLPPPQVNPPAVMTSSIETHPHADTDGASRFEVDVAVVVSRRDDDFLDDLLTLVEPTGEKTVPSVLEAHPTLGGRVADLEVTQIGSLREVDIAGSAYWAASVELEVLGLGDDG